MERDFIIEFIRKNSSIAYTDIKSIASHFSRKTFAKNEFFLKAGKTCNDFMILQRGFMRSFVFDAVGYQVTTNFYSPFQIVLEPASYYNRVASKEYIQAVTECQGWILEYQQLNLLYHTIPAFRDFVRCILVKSYMELQDRIILSLTRTAEERYLTFLKINADVVKNVSLKYIASYLGITDSSLSRIRKDTVKVPLCDAFC
ncbi:MAG: Crp/Fnr family transcriptional regulator [Bacteroidales bacterium]|nr:Crp/Fnr family transcriptional regulator [Bacteroidales bacterium]